MNPGSVTLLCVLHLKKNLERYLLKHQLELQLSSSERKSYVNNIFGNSSDKGTLLQASDLSTFRARKQQIIDYIESVATWAESPRHMSYITKLLNDLEKYVFLPSLKLGKDEANWMNNNCESINNIFKNNLQGRRPVPNLTSMVRFIQRQMLVKQKEEERAIHCIGNYEVVPHLQKKLQVSDAVWRVKDKEWQDRIIKRYYKARLPLRDEEDTSNIPSDLDSSDDDDLAATVGVSRLLRILKKKLGKKELQQALKGYTYPEHAKGIARKKNQATRSAATRTVTVRARRGRGKIRISPRGMAFTPMYVSSDITCIILPTGTRIRTANAATSRNLSKSPPPSRPGEQLCCQFQIQLANVP